MKLSLEEMINIAKALREGETVLVHNIPVRAKWLDTNSSIVPCKICNLNNKCYFLDDMSSICALVDEYKKRYAYLVLDEEKAVQ